jgi:hypothetical protein
MEKETLSKVLVVLVVLGVLSFVMTGSLAGDVKDNKVNPSAIAKEVASKVNLSASIDIDKLASEVAGKIKLPEVKSPDSDKVNDLWESIYSSEISDLEDEAYDVALNELKDHDYKAIEKYLEANVADFDELKYVEVKDYDITVVNLGLEEDEDKSATVELELRVRYTLSDGEMVSYKKTFIVTATVVFDEGDFGDESVELAFPESK